jgi:hypothetical protein
MEKSGTQKTRSPSQLIDARIKELGDFAPRSRKPTRSRLEVERGFGWNHDGMICTGETYKNVVKFTFAKGASLNDPLGLFNSSLEGNTLNKSKA